MINSDKNLPLFPKVPHLVEVDPFFYESTARKEGYRIIAGVDEAGRGPLAGPVVAAAVIIPEGTSIPGVKDSKKMTEKAREDAFPVICKKALSIGIGVISSKAIDKINILRASLEAMKEAVLFLDPSPEYVLVDGINKIPCFIPQRCIKKGDQLSQSISAASVIAKVYRDRIMRSYHELYPGYGFHRHKGYGTAFHIKALGRLGPSPVHRLTFKRVH